MSISLSHPLLVECWSERSPLATRLFRAGLSRSIGRHCVDLRVWPMVGWRALGLEIAGQRASGGTQKMFLRRRYSSAVFSDRLLQSLLALHRCECLSSKASETYLRKIRPSTTCLYSAASWSREAYRPSSTTRPRSLSWLRCRFACLPLLSRSSFFVAVEELGELGRKAKIRHGICPAIAGTADAGCPMPGGPALRRDRLVRKPAENTVE